MVSSSVRSVWVSFRSTRFFTSASRITRRSRRESISSATEAVEARSGKASPNATRIRASTRSVLIDVGQLSGRLGTVALRLRDGRGLRTTTVKPRAHLDRNSDRPTRSTPTCVKCRASDQKLLRVFPNSQSYPFIGTFRLGLLTSMPATTFVLSFAPVLTDTSGLLRASIQAPEDGRDAGSAFHGSHASGASFAQPE